MEDQVKYLLVRIQDGVVILSATDCTFILPSGPSFRTTDVSIFAFNGQHEVDNLLFIKIK